MSNANSGAVAPFQGHRGDYLPDQLVLERYQLRCPLAQGGSGVVWAARDSVLGVDVAVKIIVPPKHDLTAAFNRRAVAEARLCAQLTHPAICRVLDFGFSDRGHPVVVSELLHGETLDELLSTEQRLPAVEAVRLLLPILSALGVAHDKGIVHRDVKPGNIFLATEANGRVQPKLLDFGVARGLHLPGRRTTTGSLCGTPSYMSPEQAEGRADIDLRSDLWSFCMTLYEALSGAPAFDGDNYNAVLWAILNTEPAPLVARSASEVTLAEIVRRGLIKAPEARWSSALDLGQELVRWLLDQGVETDAAGAALELWFTTSRKQPKLRLLGDHTAATLAPGRGFFSRVLNSDAASEWERRFQQSKHARTAVLSLGVLSAIGMAWMMRTLLADPDDTRASVMTISAAMPAVSAETPQFELDPSKPDLAVWESSSVCRVWEPTQPLEASPPAPSESSGAKAEKKPGTRRPAAAIPTAPSAGAPPRPKGRLLRPYTGKDGTLLYEEP